VVQQSIGDGVDEGARGHRHPRCPIPVGRTRAANQSSSAAGLRSSTTTARTSMSSRWLTHSGSQVTPSRVSYHSTCGFESALRPAAVSKHPDRIRRADSRSVNGVSVPRRRRGDETCGRPGRAARTWQHRHVDDLAPIAHRRPGAAGG
jgi:hypothetical protein